MAPLSSGRILAEAFVKDNVPCPIEQQKPLPVGLPELAESRRLCYVAIEEALPCHECIDRDTFFTQLEKVYAKPVGDLDSDDRVFLGLVFALMGFAKRYEAGGHITTEGHFCQATTPPGLGFYHSSIQMLQLADLCSLDMVRAIIYQVLFLAANYMLSRAHTRLSIGVATALRIGLHVPNPPPGPGLETSPERVFRRRQVFSLLYAIDTYLASTLGMPKLIHQVDTCQILPLRDQDMHDRGISFVCKGPYAPEAETLVACQILVILAEIHARRNPSSKSLMLNSDSGTYELMSHEVASLDKQLSMWYNSLPPVDEIPPIKRALHAQLVIRLTYAITQMSLHRPFLHHLTRRADESNFRMDGYAQGSHCITAAMQTVW
ncbi:unnamed protein product [Fusarium equiseti]|uniref:Xylanolytic transcriptional activator regulatory domain-containing protein n=1 Tax=Fusarium equiseti TaxID=61235 RepID=A0A8J2IQ84_FUSEQ|nr:unnamed protein product [Fusarium equiseti]